jgi:hypothetical protein
MVLFGGGSLDSFNKKQILKKSILYVVLVGYNLCVLSTAILIIICKCFNFLSLSLYYATIQCYQESRVLSFSVYFATHSLGFPR